mmetsp:Transcript_59610/g.177088  ORF Transcript_59610/g.177088 Transcript_59610/m.177088 type:complete len:241 (+) Transcript_59610:174-896(+)
MGRRQIHGHLPVSLHERHAAPGPRLLDDQGGVRVRLPAHAGQEGALPVWLPLHGDADPGGRVQAEEGVRAVRLAHAQLPGVAAGGGRIAPRRGRHHHRLEVADERRRRQAHGLHRVCARRRRRVARGGVGAVRHAGHAVQPHGDGAGSGRGGRLQGRHRRRWPGVAHLQAAGQERRRQECAQADGRQEGGAKEGRQEGRRWRRQAGAETGEDRRENGRHDHAVGHPALDGHHRGGLPAVC